MKKIYFVLFTFVLFVLFSPNLVHAQAVACGDANAKSPENKCCLVDPNKISVSTDPLIVTPWDTEGKKWGCTPNWFGFQACVSDLFVSGKGIVVNVLKPDDVLTEMNNLGACPVSGFPSDVTIDTCVCKPTSSGAGLSEEFCHNYIIGNIKTVPKTPAELLQNKEYTGCIDCFRKTGYWSALGCFYIADFKTFMEKNVFGILIGLAGIIALLCIIYSAISLQLSRGNPEKIKNAQERLTSCILGLLLIIFSMFILRLIGVSILGLPGLN